MVSLKFQAKVRKQRMPFLFYYVTSIFTEKFTDYCTKRLHYITIIDNRFIPIPFFLITIHSNT